MKGASRQIACFWGCLAIIAAAAVSAHAFQKSGSSFLQDGWLALDRGDFNAAIKSSERADAAVDKSVAADALILKSYAQLGATRFEEAGTTAKSAIALSEQLGLGQARIAESCFVAAEAARKARRLDEALAFAKRGRIAGAGTMLWEGIYHLRISQIFVSKGFDISALLWLEKAEKLLSGDPRGVRHLLEVHRFQVFALSAKMSYGAALAQSDKLLKLAENSRFQYALRSALYAHGGLLSATGQSSKAYRTFARATELALKAGDSAAATELLSTVALNRLSDGDTAAAASVLKELERLETAQGAVFETGLIKAVILGTTGKRAESDALFSDLEKMPQPSPFLIPAWRMLIAERGKRWNELLERTTELREIVERANYRDDLPLIEYMTAIANRGLGRRGEAASHAGRSLQLVEELRVQSGDVLSLETTEIYHKAFRLAAELEADDPPRALSVAENFKARVLRDKIEGASAAREEFITPGDRERFLALSSGFIFDAATESELAAAERSFTRRAPEASSNSNVELDLNGADALRDSTVVSFFFTTNGDLWAWVWDKESGLRRVILDFPSEEVDRIANKTREDIINRVFFKRDGKVLFDRLLKPLGKLKSHVIFIPDRSLWKIPFQAVSPDGEKYFIEDHTVSYAPSVAILLAQVAGQSPQRRTLAAFANNSFGGRMLKYVNGEATTVASLFGSTPFLDATSAQFKANAVAADVVHLSMHAELARDRSLDSFLGFRKNLSDGGRLTVGDLLDLKLKKGSLVFIASCDTNTVNNAEGLVSLAWGMTAAGATTVVSSNWEANDRSTASFSSAFYMSLKTGQSAAESQRTASLQLIRDKSKAMHEPYYWASFTVYGDFR